MLKFTKDSFTRNLAKGKLLVQYLERYDKYDQPFEFKYEPKKGDDAWHPSGDCIPTPLSLYEKAKGIVTEGKHSPGLQKAFLVGHFWHQVLQNVLVDMEFATPESIERKGDSVWEWHTEFEDCTEQCVGGHGENCMAWKPKKTYPKPYHWACGSGDVAPLILPSGWEGILDIKTMRKGDFDVAEKSGLLPARFADKYEAQINMYMDFFDQEHGMILGVNKDSPHSFVEFVFDRNQGMIDTIYEKLEYVSKCMDDGEAPEDSDEFEFELSFTGPVS